MKVYRIVSNTTNKNIISKGNNHNIKEIILESNKITSGSGISRVILIIVVVKMFYSPSLVLFITTLTFKISAFHPSYPPPFYGPFKGFS
ncbi:hypothetical protein Glove_52g151 [Diversispora epigaea]|uniref:Uncharacterized protein n=1 Tax=Diversispora epigaea TaxID=1348612 RepID=A0A397JP77_9GLOM|nr:hypothetical protein Glove_52g151 [Diversispora epigaea]